MSFHFYVGSSRVVWQCECVCAVIMSASSQKSAVFRARSIQMGISEIKHTLSSKSICPRCLSHTQPLVAVLEGGVELGVVAADALDVAWCERGDERDGER